MPEPTERTRPDPATEYGRGWHDGYQDGYADALALAAHVLADRAPGLLRQLDFTRDEARVLARAPVSIADQLTPVPKPRAGVDGFKIGNWRS